MKQRPVGITILAVLHCAGGVFLLGMLLYLLPALERMGDRLEGLGLPPAWLAAGTAILALLIIASGLGMWLGKQWGWWLAAFYYTLGIARHANALVMVFLLADQMEGGARGPGYYYGKYGGRVVIHALILLYFFKSNVLEFFGLEHLHKGKALWALVRIVVVIGVAVWLASWLHR